MVVYNPPLHDPDMPHHEHYATEGKTKMYRAKRDKDSAQAVYKREESLARRDRSMKEHEHPYWEGRDHS